MKNFLFVFILSIASISCSNDNDSFEINGTFTHDLLNCNNSQNPENSCTEYVWFNNNSNTASIMLSGSDYGAPVTYKLKSNKIDFYYMNGVKAELSFELKNQTTFIRLENNDIWLKDE
ncbi:hypothetical protein EV196_107214 [Mariniflexile fucanivorans]|uniref:Lipoprotein n=1 Tax=Mariniflexile fucanivorans TaxID=264023 RepID=A0A4R1REZ7_9FLAO|nr:hypothetical protein [Mariniflexile fucanivorans]TCL64505.1 hypothetical protein EV196_107214 [Mariniflexile fucanivorans]